MRDGVGISELEHTMSENFYPPRDSKPRNPYALVAVLVVFALLGGIAAGYALARSTRHDLEREVAGARDDDSAPAKPTSVSALPIGEFKPMHEEGSLLTYRMDAEITGGGTESGEFSEVYMNFGSDVSLFTKHVADDGSADLKFVFDNTALVGTFFESPFELHFSSTPVDTAGEAAKTQAPDSPQTTFLTKPIEMRIGPDGEVLSISSPSSLKDMLGSIVTVPQLKFPEGELSEGRQWITRLSMPVPGIANAVDTTVVNTFLGVEKMGNYECGVVRQHIGATDENTQASAPAGADEKPMMFSVPLFDLQGENMVYFDTASGQLVHAKLDMTFALRIKEQLGEAGSFLQQIMPRMSGEKGATDIEDILSAEKPDLMDLSLHIDGAISLVNDGPPLPL